jgi:hypothetical protein
VFDRGSAPLHVTSPTAKKVGTTDPVLKALEEAEEAPALSNDDRAALLEAAAEAYRTTDRIQFGVRKEEPLRAQAAQFRELLVGGDAGERCTGSDALAAVLLAERAVQVEHGRSRPKTAPSSHALPALDDEWV